MRNGAHFAPCALLRETSNGAHDGRIGFNREVELAIAFDARGVMDVQDVEPVAARIVARTERDHSNAFEHTQRNVATHVTVEECSDDEPKHEHAYVHSGHFSIPAA